MRASGLALAFAGFVAMAACGGEQAMAPQLTYPPWDPTSAASLTAPAPRALVAPDAAARAVVAYAAAQVGKPYCWGGTGPRCFDCSGLAMMAWRQVGVRVPRTADDVARELPPVALADVRPGDILWWPGHVGIYAGNGWSLEALDHQSGVVRRRLMSPRRAFRPRV